MSSDTKLANKLNQFIRTGSKFTLTEQKYKSCKTMLFILLRFSQHLYLLFTSLTSDTDSVVIGHWSSLPTFLKSWLYLSFHCQILTEALNIYNDSHSKCVFSLKYMKTETRLVWSKYKLRSIASKHLHVLTLWKVPLPKKTNKLAK